MKRSLPWSEFKHALQSRRAALQMTETADLYRLSFHDGPVEFKTTIFKAAPPDGSGISGPDNMTAKTEFEASFKALTNLPVEARTTDSVPFVSANMFPPWASLYFTGAADASERGNGETFSLSRSAAGDEMKEFSFLDGLYAAGGGVFWRNGNPGDTISLECHSEGTPVTPTPGTGNCNLVEVPGVGAVMIVPAYAGGGSHTVDLTNARPIPAIDDMTQQGVGFWDWSDPWTGKGVVTPAAPLKGKWYLFTIHMVLGRFANRIPLLGDGQLPLQVDTIKPKYFLPHWHWHVNVHRETTATPALDVSFYLMTARKKTT